MNYLVYDCEIVKCIPTTAAAFTEYEYCDGWRDFENMGVSVIGAYSSQYDHLGYILGADLDTFQQMIREHDLIVGFNSKAFDDCLMAANKVRVTTGYDLLEEIRIAAGFDRNWESVPKGYSYSLDAIARVNGLMKTGSGALAPQLWQQGKHQEVIDYCLNDVKITHEILLKGLNGELRDPNTGAKLELAPLA